MVLVDSPMIIWAIIKICMVFIKKKLRDRMAMVKSGAQLAVYFPEERYVYGDEYGGRE